MRGLGVCIAASLAGCASSQAPSELPPGQWGGEHISMTVSATGARLEFDCAHGTADEPPQLDSEGRFDLSGVYVRERGGPIPEGESGDRHDAVYVGRLEGSRVTLAVLLTDDGTWIGPFAARLGERPMLVKCL